MSCTCDVTNILVMFSFEARKVDNIRIKAILKANFLLRSYLFSVCEIQYNNVCYWMEVHSAYDINFAEAKSICRQRHSTVADVVDETQYDLLVEKIRSKIPSGGRDMWIGLKQNPSVII